MANHFQSVQTPISLATGTTSLVPAPSASQRVRVMSLYVVATAATTFQLKGSVSGVTTGAVSLAANGVMVLPYSEDGWFVTQPGDALQVIVGAGAIAGSLNYVSM